MPRPQNALPVPSFPGVALPLLLGLCLLLLPVTAAGAQKAAPGTWPERAEEADALVREGKHALALKKTGRLVEEMAVVLLAGERSSHTLATTLHLHALAQAGAGEQRAAEWNLYLAYSLSPALLHRDLSPYGEAGRRLEEVQEVGARVVPQTLAAWEEDDGTSDRSEGHAVGEAGKEVREAAPGTEREMADDESCDEFTPPVKRKMPLPLYPRTLRASGVEGLVLLQFIVDTDGQLSRPVLIKAPTPGMGYLVAKSMSRWVFEPARCDGEPVESYYNVTINMSLER